MKLKNQNRNELIFKLELRIESVPFQVKEIETNRNGLIKIDPYEPNTVWTFSVNKTTDSIDDGILFKIGILIEIEYLRLDFDRNDYLMIGPGSNGKFWVQSKSQMIAKDVDPNENLRFYVHTETAFIRIVTHNSLKKIDKIFRAKWHPPSTPVRRPKNADQPSRMKSSSMQLCFQEDCNRWNSETRNKFLKEFVHCLNTYLIDHEPNANILIDSESILIFDIQNEIDPKGHKTCQMNIAVSNPYNPLLPLIDSVSLHKMYFGGDRIHQRKIIYGTKVVTDCSQPQLTYWKIVTPILVIIGVSSLITLTFWSQFIWN
ncbi:yorkie [Sarcoptes scabiei]|nr:yorkie [Sarcoptes scabiei]